MAAPSVKPHSVLFYPPVEAVRDALKIWSLSYATNFPLALLRLGSQLSAAGHRVTLLDAFLDGVPDRVNPEVMERLILGMTPPECMVREAPMGDFAREGRTKPVFRIGLGRDEIVRRLRSLGRVDNVYISSLFTWTWRTTHEAVELCKEVHPKASVHLGGIYPTLCPDKAKGSGADVVCTGRMPGLDVARPDLSLSKRRFFDASILKTSVGCPNRCTYCAVHSLEGRRMQYRDPEDVAGEVRNVFRRFGVREFHFWESNLLLNPDRHFLPMMERLAATGIPLSLMAPEGVQANLIDERTAVCMFKGGFKNVFLTVETTDQAWSKKSKRPAGFDDLKRAVGLLKKAGFKSGQLVCVLLIGRPGQDRASVLRDICRVFSLGCPVSLLVYTLIPGTEDYDLLGRRYSRIALEDLDPLLFPFASKALSCTDMERLVSYFNFRHFPLRRIASSRTKDDLIVEMQELIAGGV